MSAKEEFFTLISTSFSSDEVDEVRKATDKLEAELRSSLSIPDELAPTIKALYFDLCSLFYRTAKGFDNFFVNLQNRQLPNLYTRHVLIEEDEEDARKARFYTVVLDKIQTFINSRSLLKDSSLNRSLCMSLTNAVAPEMYAQSSSEKRLAYCENLKQMAIVAQAIKEGKSITRITFDINNQPTVSIKDPSAINNLWDDYIIYTSYRQHRIIDLDTEIERLQSQVDYSMKRIALRICMIFVRFGILTTTTTSIKHILKNENGQYISLSQETMYIVYLLIKELGLKFVIRDGEQGINYPVGNTKEESDKVKNLLRAGKKPINDNFTYADIDDSYMGCIIGMRRTM